ncbi:MAG: RNA polymerase sigma factor [Bacteroidota bacterium]|nr:RNA polymerase sigma factor [Ferruginibacter sp.]
MNESEELIEQLKKGDQSSFSVVVNKYQDLVYNTALGIVQNAEDADDITQEVFVQVHLSVSSFKGDSKFSTWLYRITISKALDHEKKKKRKKRFAFVQSLFGSHEAEDIHPVEFNHPGVQLERKESAADLFRALKQLPENQRIAFTLHKVEGQTHQEIAAIMNLSIYAVESLMGRAKANLKKLLEVYYHKKIA